jgi:hypothetical protein
VAEPPWGNSLKLAGDLKDAAGRVRGQLVPAGEDDEDYSFGELKTARKHCADLYPELDDLAEAFTDAGNNTMAVTLRNAADRVLELEGAFMLQISIAKAIDDPGDADPQTLKEKWVAQRAELLEVMRTCVRQLTAFIDQAEKLRSPQPPASEDPPDQEPTGEQDLGEVS